MNFAIALPALLCLCGVAIDYGSLFMKQSRLQAVADAAAIAGARELTLPNVKPRQIESAVASSAGYHNAQTGISVSHKVTVNFELAEVTVELNESWTPFFAHVFDAGVTPIKVNAKAKLLHAQEKICVLTLHSVIAKAVHLSQDAVLTANGCGVYVNSTHGQAIRLDDDTHMKASLICSAGGAQINKVGNVSPEPISDCPPLDDPLAGRPPPPEAANGCDFNKFKIDGGTPPQPLEPGVYCGGLTIRGDAHVRLGAGTYVIRNGAFTIAETAVVEGQDVGFYLEGNKSVIDFTGDTTIRLSGPESGPMAGLLFFEDRASPINNKHHIASSNADTLVGTIYLSRGELFVDPNASVAAKSAYTAIIANQLTLTEGPELVLNADYGATTVPVPPGITVSGSVVLAE